MHGTTVQDEIKRIVLVVENNHRNYNNIIYINNFRYTYRVVFRHCKSFVYVRCKKKVYYSRATQCVIIHFLRVHAELGTENNNIYYASCIIINCFCRYVDSVRS